MTKSELRAEIATLSAGVKVTVIPAKKIRMKKTATARISPMDKTGCRAGGSRLDSGAGRFA